MIIDNIDNAQAYYGLNQRLRAALKCLENVDFAQVEPGRYGILGDECFALVQTYDTKPAEEGKWESHRKYIDIQFIAEGTERIGYANTDMLKITDEYDESRDVMFFDGQGEFFDVTKGNFMIFTPKDAHMPSIAAGEPKEVKKVVVKVAV